LLSPTERAAVLARFRAKAAVSEVMAEYGVPGTSARRLRDEAALIGRRGAAFAASVVVCGARADQSGDRGG
jgi:hypothetical protein